MTKKHTSGPIRPDEVVAAKREILPSFVFSVVNELIAKKWNGSYSNVKQQENSNVKQQEIIDELKKFTWREEPVTVSVIFANNFLDFEKIYEEAGWRVEYDKPAYNEDYDAFFVFKKK